MVPKVSQNRYADAMMWCVRFQTALLQMVCTREQTVCATYVWRSLAEDSSALRLVLEDV